MPSSQRQYNNNSCQSAVIRLETARRRNHLPLFRSMRGQLLAAGVGLLALTGSALNGTAWAGAPTAAVQGRGSHAQTGNVHHVASNSSSSSSRSNSNSYSSRNGNGKGRDERLTARPGVKPTPPANGTATGTQNAGVKPAVAAAATGAVAATGAAAVLEPPAGPLLQLGLYSTKGEAEWAWIALSRKMPELPEQLTQHIYTDSNGAVLRVAVKSADADGDAVCRRIINHGQGCFVVRGAIRTANAATGESDKVPSATTPPAVQQAQATPVQTTAPVQPSAARVAPVPTTAAQTVPSSPVTVPPPSPAGGQTLTTVIVPPGTTITAVPTAAAGTTPVNTTNAGNTVTVAAGIKPETTGTPSKALDGFFPYNADDAKVLAEIERRTRRRGRIGAVLPGGGLEVTPAILTQPEFNICAVTFDDGPHRTITRRILEILNAEKVVATYFPIGNVAIRYPDIIRDWVKSGHEVGNHSYTHGDLRSMKPEQQRFEVEETNKVLREMGATATLFRPPYGRYNGELLKIVKDVGSQAVLWNVDTRDWKDRDPDKIVEHVVTAAGSGSVLLMHSTYGSTADALPRVVRILRDRNCEFVTMTDWLARMQAAGEIPVTNASLPAPVVASRIRN